MKHQHHRRPGGWQQAQQPDASDAAEWFAGRLPDTWFAGDPTVIVDREEITVIGHLPDPADAESEARASGRAARFREETRPYFRNPELEGRPPVTGDEYLGRVGEPVPARGQPLPVPEHHLGVGLDTLRREQRGEQLALPTPD